MKQSFPLLMLILLMSFSRAFSASDSIIHKSELKFQSIFEKESFDHLDNISDLKLCLATDKNMTEAKATEFLHSFNSISSSFQNEKLTTANFRQKFEITYKYFAPKKALQYYDKAELYDFLTNGYFNHLTASALYTLLLQEMKLPVHLVYNQNKTHIIINPTTAQTIIECSDKKNENGFYSASGTNEKIFELLDKNMRMGTEYKYNTSGQAEYTFKESDLIAKKQLAATLYYQKAINQHNENNDDLAFELMSKAYYLYPNPNYNQVMSDLLNIILGKASFDNIEDVNHLAMISRFNSANNDNITSSFSKLLQNHGITKDDLPFCKKAYNTIIPQINDITLANNLSYLYYLTEFCNNKTTPIRRLALNYEMLKLRPNDQNAHMMFNQVKYSLFSNTDEVNIEQILDTINKFEPTLLNLEIAEESKELKLKLFLNQAGKFFRLKNEDGGNKYLDLFEKAYDKNKYKSEFRVAIENAYAASIRYYISKNNRTMAQKKLAIAEQFVPHSNYLESELITIKRSTRLNIIEPKQKTKKQETDYQKYNRLKATDK